MSLYGLLVLNRDVNMIQTNQHNSLLLVFRIANELKFTVSSEHKMQKYIGLLVSMVSYNIYNIP